MKEFTCNSSQLADFLTENGSEFLGTEVRDGYFVYVFTYDDTIEDNLDAWAASFKKCMF